MVDVITKEQLEEIEYARLTDRDEYHQLLKEYAGIIAEPYTAFSYYDEFGNYLGDSDNSSTYDLLEAAYVEVADNAVD